MADQVLKDRNNKTIGTIKKLSNGKLEIRDAANHHKGTYDPKTNKTYDHANHAIGTGNLLTSLL